MIQMKLENRPARPGAIHSMVLAVGLATTSAALFGAAFAGLALLVGWNVGSVFKMAAYFAACGAVAGGLISVFRAMVDTGSNYAEGDASGDYGVDQSRPCVYPLLLSHGSYPVNAAAYVAKRDIDDLAGANLRTHRASDMSRYRRFGFQQGRLQRLLELRGYPLGRG